MVWSKDVKVSLQNNDGSIKEIRRFIYNDLMVVTFDDVYKKIRSLFPELHNKDFIILWIDDENDKITVASNDEFASVKKTIDKKFIEILRLYIQVPNENKKVSPPKEEGVFHFNIACDGCNSDILGFRYKCIQCDNFDLCSQCEALNLHADHWMIRMPRELEWSSHHGRALLHHIRKFIRRSETRLRKDNLNECPMRRCHEPSANNPNLFSLFDKFVPYFNGSNDRKTEANADDAGASKEAPAQEDKENVKTQQVFKLLKKDITQFLDPFGINIDIQIDDNNTNVPQTDEQKKEEKSKENVSNVTNVDPSKQFPKESRKSTDSIDDNTCESDATSAVHQDTTTPKTLPTDEWTIVDKSDASDISSSSSVSSSLSKMPETQVSSSELASPTAPKEDSSRQKIYPELPKEERVFHPDPVIHNALQTMILMGFSNNGGILTSLLETEGGNINKVLDILQSGQQ
ncbi:PREDICTED: sequestosome-1 [Dufourea novaeangliae]|uniref:sequestosome-1 n=1 Tax=Dufourea novaeangliae TaxID=178035 RepID=UPI000767C575|nr:PREDICTED: sequestosome-1 [Dufourea novaeangliae]